MAPKDLKAAYRSIHQDFFPKNMEISFFDDNSRQTLIYEKVSWTIEGEEKGLRYGENPGQDAALYKMVNGNLCLGDVACIGPGNELVSGVELIKSGKHPGKTNLTDADAALNILRYLDDGPAVVIVKHNNPCGVAVSNSLPSAYHKALMADRVAAFGGAVAVNRPLDLETAKLIVETYCEVVVAPEFEEGVMEVLNAKKNLRVFLIRKMDRLASYANYRTLEMKSLIDGGVITQWSFVPKAQQTTDFLPAETEHKGKTYKVNRQPSQQELNDMLFGWKVEAGVTSNSVLYVKDGVTVGIGTGEQDRVGVAEIARDKAYRKLADRICWEKYQSPYNLMEDKDKKNAIDQEVASLAGGLPGSVMISDAFFPFRDGIDVGLKEGVKAVLQPGGSMRDYEVIEACNEFGATMMFTGQRSFRH
jgi:phosphoribosylaminoimidazolecarboxamide formyltransferase/IMP cyclohydrolase